MSSCFFNYFKELAWMLRSYDRDHHSRRSAAELVEMRIEVVAVLLLFRVGETGGFV